jgi:hypothetical protein
LLKLVEIVGEAPMRVSAPMQTAHPEIPWRAIIGTRNRLVHGYDSVDRDILWDIVAIDFPPLAPHIRRCCRRCEAPGRTQPIRWSVRLPSSRVPQPHRAPFRAGRNGPRRRGARRSARRTSPGRASGTLAPAGSRRLARPLALHIAGLAVQGVLVVMARCLSKRGLALQPLRERRARGCYWAIAGYRQCRQCWRTFHLPCRRDWTRSTVG